MKNKPELRSFLNKRLKIGLLGAEHIEAIRELRNSDFVRSNMVYRLTIGSEDQQKWFLASKDGSCIRCSIQWDEEVVGLVDLKKINYETQTCEWGLFVSEKASRLGIGAFAAAYILSYAFETLGMGKVFAQILSSNSAAISLNRQLGFAKIKEEGSIEIWCLSDTDYKLKEKIFRRLVGAKNENS